MTFLARLDRFIDNESRRVEKYYGPFAGGIVRGMMLANVVVLPIAFGIALGWATPR